MAFTALTESPAKNRLILDVWGKPKSGKTTLALTFPEPIFYFNWDLGLDHHVERLRDSGKDIRVATYLCSPLMTPEDTTAVIKEFERDFATALKELGTGTMVWDTASDLWALISKRVVDEAMARIRKKAAERGREAPDKPPMFEYGPANAYWLNLVRTVKNSTGNLVLIEREKPVYDEGGRDTGRTARQGQKDNGYAAEMTLRMDTRRNADGIQHYAQVESTVFGDAMVGMEVANPTFDTLMGLVKAMGYQ